MSKVTKYYTFGASRVAMRQGNVVYYLHGDHLGSTSLTTNQSGVLVSQARYLPYGEERWTDKASPTDFGFTSQRKEAGFGLMDYNARYYSPYLGRFISADMVVPDATNPQDWNRYSYVGNNPLKYQ
ncbi:MAG: RHS repeat-associated core domain-containing protein [Anaerolineales bacterium]|nr:RHS repeat-associated core domain-containing protein [Anaerolineales bacterium]